jgi:hypothetical protein
VSITGNTETLVIDGHAALNTSDIGYRILLTNQTVDSENGIYEYTEATGVYTLTRTEDADTYTEIIGAAVFVMEGTTYGQTSWVQSDHYLTDFTGQEWTQFSGSGSVVAGTGITVDGLEVSIDRTTVDTWYDAAGTAQGIVDALDSDDIEEGATNEYFTDVRAKTSAANLLTSASLTNITITGDETGLTITAENGVADSDTDDLTEGTTNLYFTNQRAIDALEGTNPTFESINIDEIAKQVAATTGNIVTASTVTAYSFAKAEYRSAKFLVRTAYSTHTEISEVLLTLDTSDNIAITEYAIVGTNGSSMTVSADISGTDVRLRVTTINNNSIVTVMGTLIA